MSEIDLSEIKKRAGRSFVSLTGRQIFLRLIGFLTINIVLARVLPVESLGIFNVASAIITFFAFFSDIGLGAALIQKGEKVKQEDINTTFSIQLVIAFLLSAIIIIVAPWLGSFYGLNNDGVWLIRALGFSFLLTSLKIVPSVLLERYLKFTSLVTVEVVETVTFNFLLILLVYQGLNIWSFSVAAVVRSVVGVIAIYLIAPTKIGLGINKVSARELLTFGIPFQLNSILALVKDRLVPLVVARMVGPIGIGYITWAQALAFLPLEIMNIINRISFPAFSRLQEDSETLTKAVEKSLFVTSLVAYPALFGLGAILPSIVDHVVSSKWQPAVASYYLFAISSFWAIISTTFTNVLNATGQIKTTLKLMIMWTVLTWALTPLLVAQFGFIGVALASFIISFTSLATIILVKRSLQVKVLNSITLPIVASVIMAVLVFLFSQYFVVGKVTLVMAIILGGIIYSGLVYLFGKERILNDLKSLRGR